MATTKNPENFSGSYRLENIVLEEGEYWALRVSKGFEIYKIGATASTRCAQIGYEGDIGMAKVRAEVDRRQAVDVARAAELQLRVRPAASSSTEPDVPRERMRA